MCSVCGSERLEGVEGNYRTGVVAPDGGEEWAYYVGIKCLDCGATEDL